MVSSVELQAPMAFQQIWVWLAAVLIIAAIFLQIFFRIRRKRMGDLPPRKIKIKKPPAKLLPEIKARYLTELDLLERELSAGLIDVRTAFQRLSAAIRNFVYEVTGIEVPNYTLYEIRQLNMPRLTKLIEEYYAPEFARSTRKKGFSSINMTREVIRRWY